MLYGRKGDGISVVGNQFCTRTVRASWIPPRAAICSRLRWRSAILTATSAVISPSAFQEKALHPVACSREHAGAVNVLHGGKAGLRASDDPATADVDEEDQFWHQDTPGVADAVEAHDHFGGGRIKP